MAIFDELYKIRAEAAEIHPLDRYKRTLAQVQELEAATGLYRECEAKGWPFEGPHRRIFEQHLAQAAALGTSRAFETPERARTYETR